MSSTRQLKYSKLIQKELSEIFQQDKRGILDNAFVTIADVRMSPDLSVAKVYISMLLAKEKEKTLEKINTRKSDIRKALGNKIGNQVPIIPELILYKDDVEENAQHLDELIKNLHIPPTTPEKSERGSDDHATSAFWICDRSTGSISRIPKTPSKRTRDCAPLTIWSSR